MIGQHIRDSLPTVCVLIFIAAVGFLGVQCMFGCTPAASPQDLPKYCYSEPLYTAELLRCVDRAETLAESQMCRQRVDHSCGVRRTVKK